MQLCADAIYGWMNCGCWLGWIERDLKNRSWCPSKLNSKYSDDLRCYGPNEQKKNNYNFVCGLR
jgi:hypothetical protein